jgi:putative transposase
MMTSKFTDEQIAMALRHAETATPVGEICRKLGISEQSFYRWGKRFAARGSASSGSCASSGRRIAN